MFVCPCDQPNNYTKKKGDNFSCLFLILKSFLIGVFNRLVHGNVTTSIDLMRAMVNDDKIDHYCVGCVDYVHDRGRDLDHDCDHGLDLLNVDFVVCIVWQLHDDHRNIDPSIGKIHDEDNTGKVMSLRDENEKKSLSDIFIQISV